MSDLVAIAFPTEARAEEFRQKLVAMQKEYLIDLGDAVIAVKDSNGHIKLNRMINSTAADAISGTFWGALIDDRWMKKTAATVQPGTQRSSRSCASSPQLKCLTASGATAARC